MKARLLRLLAAGSVLAAFYGTHGPNWP